MNSRYYIYGDKVYYRYNRRITGSGRALRNEDVERAFRIRKVTRSIMLLCAAIVIVVSINFLCSAIMKMGMKEILAAASVDNLLEEVDEVEPELIPAEKIKSPTEKSLQPKSTVSDTITKVQSKSIQTAHTESQTYSYYQMPKTTEEDQYVSDLVYRQPSQPSNDPVNVSSNISPKEVTIGDYDLIEMPLPSAYYQGLDFSSFQPFEPVDKITNKKSSAYKLCNSENTYVDSDGLMRYEVPDGAFSVDGIDDYIVAMGTFYKTKGVIGERFLIETTAGSFTVIIGDEKSDAHTDDMNMYTTHGGKAGIIEWIVDDRHLDSNIKSAGTVTAGSIPETHGTITHIYKIV